MRIIALGILLLSAAGAFAQSFDVASIKPWTSREVGGVYTYPGGRVAFRGCTLEYLIQQALNIQQFQITGGPGWVRNDRFDIDAKPPESSASSKSNPPYTKAPMNAEQRRMLQALLEDRFQLHFHREEHEGPVYLLQKTNKPLRMTDSKDKNEYPWARVAGGGMVGTNENMPDLAWRLSQEVGRPVENQTGIEGSFDFDTRQGPDERGQDYVAMALAAVQELGLKLEPAKGKVETIVVDRAEKPSGN